MPEPVEPAPSIHDAITAIKADVGAIGKSERNTQQGWVFRGVDTTVNAVAPVLIKHRVTITPVATTYAYEQIRVGADAKIVGQVIVTVTYRWTGPAGDSVETTVIGQAMDTGDKAGAKAMSVAYRTCILQTLSLPTHERDPDHDIYDRVDAVQATVASTVRAVDQAVADSDVEAVRAIYRATPASVRRLLADPDTGRDLDTYMQDAGRKISMPPDQPDKDPTTQDLERHEAEELTRAGCRCTAEQLDELERTGRRDPCTDHTKGTA